MTTCPWCETSYATFQSNCKNCGGPIPYNPQAPAPAVETRAPLVAPPATPPPAPRPISNNFTVSLMRADNVSIAGLVFSIFGAMFTGVGVLMTILVDTGVVGPSFVMIGLCFLFVGGGLLYFRYQEKQKVTEVLRSGEAVLGQVTGLKENLMTRINGHYPWVIGYQFPANGQVYNGSIATFNIPDAGLQPDSPVYVLYQPEAPQRNALYPHP